MHASDASDQPFVLRRVFVAEVYSLSVWEWKQERYPVVYFELGIIQRMHKRRRHQAAASAYLRTTVSEILLRPHPSLFLLCINQRCSNQCVHMPIVGSIREPHKVPIISKCHHTQKRRKKHKQILVLILMICSPCSRSWHHLVLLRPLLPAFAHKINLSWSRFEVSLS